MLKKSERLGRAAFAHYFKVGKRTHGTYLTLITFPAPTFFSAVVVGKKVSNLAPARNSLRRRIYALLAKLKTEKNLTGVFIVITKPEIAKLSKKSLVSSVGAEVGKVLN
jgi:ribonuclease P protein component